MAGIYVHIPFCKSRCIYCDFFSTTRLEQRSRYIDALIKEYSLRGTYLPKGEPIRTIYIGGGTPSLLAPDDVARLLHSLPTNEAVEITLEANPSDITEAKLLAWHEAGINRLSMGVQSLNDDLLRFIGRRHDASQAVEAVRLAQQCGFSNISIDLIYGLPHQTMAHWQADINQALTLGVQHISTYCLSFEPHTRLDKMRADGIVQEADEDTANAMYAHICNRLRQEGWNHYEVSNFALPGFESRHNSSYWDDTPYLGLGAGAHSYDGKSRQWNIADLDKYISAITAGQVPCESEMLSETDRYNERIMLGLRTSRGITATDGLLQKAAPYIESGKLRVQDGKIIATPDGINILNVIITDLMQ
ncbi:MAG: radical SAM family heme chaperone HemW [Paludibacteraceae bacterium]|nr:radical SAM family heme chaperone HemW [Paludibacteraceae bacterium]